MRPGGKSNGESPFFETPNLSFEGRVRNVASEAGPTGTARASDRAGHAGAHRGPNARQTQRQNAHPRTRSTTLDHDRVVVRRETAITRVAGA